MRSCLNLSKRGVVHSKYSENELIEIGKGYGNVSEWEAFMITIAICNEGAANFNLQG